MHLSTHPTHRWYLQLDSNRIANSAQSTLGNCNTQNRTSELEDCAHRREFPLLVQSQACCGEETAKPDMLGHVHSIRSRKAHIGLEIDYHCQHMQTTWTNDFETQIPHFRFWLLEEVLPATRASKLRVSTICLKHEAKCGHLPDVLSVNPSKGRERVRKSKSESEQQPVSFW